ncbi:MAG: hypothetical protein L6Q37_02405 [Bdellovibrionaceae bacterium]|nr:hypothetical protein [Pseudobdellovibrionaceae bacterium]NUM58536.1 hypothetical protein [Pseudobdellovibrionaceae bacterium]
MNQESSLLTVAHDKRDVSWENNFFNLLTASHVNILSADPQIGPDNWPYLMAEWNEKSDKTMEPDKEETQKVIQWLSDKGIGLVINPMKEYPDYVFTYGMIWSFKETGFFYRTDTVSSTESLPSDGTTQFYYGPPSQQYLPDYVRKVLREFFRDQGLMNVKLLMLSSDNKEFDLAFSLESLGNPPKEEHEGIAEAISWFLPPHYPILLIGEKNLPTFIDL